VQHAASLGAEAGERGACLREGVLALGVEGLSETVEEHVFFGVGGDGWCY
jgi:hypothetical protein